MILAAQWYHTILGLLFAVVAVLLMIVILLQRGRGVGLAGAFGGAPGSTAFGAKTGDVLTWVTIVAAAVMLTFGVVLTFLFREAGPGLATAAAQTPQAQRTQAQPSGPPPAPAEPPPPTAVPATEEQPTEAPSPPSTPAEGGPGGAWLFDGQSAPRLCLEEVVFGYDRA